MELQGSDGLLNKIVDIESEGEILIQVVLFQPEIPQNTGNIIRTCASTGTPLHLIGPMGFAMDDKKLKRAGLDYWDHVCVGQYTGFDDFFEKNQPQHLFLLSTHGTRFYTQVHFPEDAFLMFGRETAGLPDEIRERFSENCLRIPMIPNNRSLNLSNTVALVLYEALRQWDFQGLV
jgi:tRNA (cytidine/uridine-2'-O-)-methyltransferase